MYSAQAAYDAIKTARYAQKGAVAAQRPWKAAYDAFIQKAWRYWHPEDTERSKGERRASPGPYRGSLHD